MIRHTIRLVGPNACGARVSIHILRALSDALLEAAQRSLRLRVEGRSKLQGKTPWLEAATDLVLVGLHAGSTLLEFEAPTLGEAAPEIFEQLPLWDYSPRKEQSALSLVEETLRDAFAANRESDLLDRSILDSVTAFRKVLDHGLDAIELDGSGTTGPEVQITRAGLATAEHLREEAPPPQRVIVTGWLDQLTGSKRAFNLKLSSSQILRGLLPPGDPRTYASLFTQKVVVDGEARFRPSGAVSLIVASSIRPASPSDAAWEQVPRPRPRSLEELQPRTPAPVGTNRMERVFGHWPGDESPEELLAALEEMS
jgi:hypothetical protein